MSTLISLTLAQRLPDIPTLRRRCQAIAMLDAILCPEPEYRYYAYDRHGSLNKDRRPGWQLAAMRDGTGNEYSVVFSPEGAVIRGFARASERSPYRCDPPEVWPDLVDGLPPALEPLLGPFHRDGVLDATVVAWREPAAQGWSGPAPDEESDQLFRVVAAASPASEYHRFAQDYYEVWLEPEAVAHVFAHAPLTEELVHELTPNAALGDLIADCEAIGWSISGSVPLTDRV